MKTPKNKNKMIKMMRVKGTRTYLVKSQSQSKSPNPTPTIVHNITGIRIPKPGNANAINLATCHFLPFVMP